MQIHVSHFMRLCYFMCMLSHSLSMHAKLSSGARGLMFGLSLHLDPFYVCANNKGSSKIVHSCRLAWEFIVHVCAKITKYNLLWFKERVFLKDLNLRIWFELSVWTLFLVFCFFFLLFIFLFLLRLLVLFCTKRNKTFESFRWFILLKAVLFSTKKWLKNSYI